MGWTVCGWDGAAQLHRARGEDDAQLEAGFREKRANASSSSQARTTAPIVNTFARSYAADAKATPTEVTSILEQRIRGVQEESGLAETGRVLSVG